MADVKVELSQDNAILLLDAAEKDGQEPDVVRTSNGSFIVDEALAKKAKVDYTTGADEEKAFAAQLKADDEASGYKRTAADRKAAAQAATTTEE